MKTISKILALAAFAYMAGCQTRITWTKNPEAVTPIQSVVKVQGKDTIITTDAKVASGGYTVTARSPLWADEALKGLNLSVTEQGAITFGLAEYRRDLSTNAVTMAHNLVVDFATLAEKAAAAYASCGASLATAKAQSAVQRSIASYILKGGKADKATATCANGLCTFSDGVVTESCPYGNCDE